MVWETQQGSSSWSLADPPGALSLPRDAFGCPAQEQATSSLACLPALGRKPPSAKIACKGSKQGTGRKLSSCEVAPQMSDFLHLRGL